MLKRIFPLVFLFAGMQASAAVIFDEASNGDLANSFFFPTSIGGLSAGDKILGTTSNGFADADHFWFTAQSPISGFLFEASNPFGDGFLLVNWELREYDPSVPPPGLVGFVGSSYLLSTNLLTGEYLTTDGSNGPSTPLTVGETYLMRYTGGSYQPSFAGEDVGFNYSITALPNPVPLPATAWLFLSGLAGLALASRRKKQAI